MKKLFLLFATVTLLIGFQACKQKEVPVDNGNESKEVVIPEGKMMCPACEGSGFVDKDTTRLPVPPKTPQ